MTRELLDAAVASAYNFVVLLVALALLGLAVHEHQEQQLRTQDAREVCGVTAAGWAMPGATPPAGYVPPAETLPTCPYTVTR